MLALTNISLRRGRKVLFENASFQIHAGQRMGVIGANGSGKSSLFAMHHRYRRYRRSRSHAMAKAYDIIFRQLYR